MTAFANLPGEAFVEDDARRSRPVQIICADPDLAHRYLRELERSGSLREFVLVVSARQAEHNVGQLAPLVTLLDESAMRPGDSLEGLAIPLGRIAPVVVVASPERAAGLNVSSNVSWLDFVPRTGKFVPAAAGRLQRRMCSAENGSRRDVSPTREAARDFGEMLRHEVNNPLTGILGNAELLLARRDRLPPAAIERLETIAELAVRLRETVLHLSHTWEKQHDQVTFR